MDSPDSDNPFAAPATRSDQTIATDRPRKSFALIVAWNVAVLLNVPLPAMMGQSFTDQYGPAGMAMGVLAVASLGTWLCLASRRIMLRITIGSMLPAVLQLFFPVLQMIAGIIAVSLTRLIFFWSLGDSPGLSGIAPAMTATLLTGIFLILPSLIVGAIVCSIFSIDK
ncbi:MAG: hypothetical protein KDA96_19930 [Planctomycetaceae bacterium]|nr:hypothetical protein [Planctomycetaceae bacterium]